MTQLEKVVAALGAISISMVLIFKGELTPAVAIAGSLVGYFVGETNGKKIAQKS